MFENKSIDELKLLLIKASDSYYNKSESIIPDKEFDDLRDYVKSINPNDPVLKTIGAKVSKESKWEKSSHKIPMGSLDKVNTVEEFTKWHYNIDKEMLLVEEKLDGISIELIYQNGKLIDAITRGGEDQIGEVITKNVIRMQNVKINLPIEFSGSLRGEIVLKHKDFDFINSILVDRGEKEFANPRNAASGIATNFDGEFSEYLTILYYDCISVDDFYNENIEHQLDKLIFIKDDLNLDIVPYYCFKPEDIYNEYIVERRNNCEYDIDGLVLIVNNISVQKQLGEKDLKPKFAIAWKFPNMQVETTIKDVIWQMGNTNRITPVAILEPVKLCGVIIQRATLSNLDIFKSFEFKYGDKIVIERANDVIPKILSNLGGGSKDIEIPEYCPACQHKLIQEETFLICDNSECQGKYLGNLIVWTKNVFTGKGMAEETIKMLYENKLINYPYNFYNLQLENLVGLPKVGKRKAEVILDVINSGREVELAKFIKGLNLDGFGESRAELLIENGYNTIEKMCDISLKELIAIKGIESITANKFLDSIKNKNYIINELLKCVRIKELKQVETKSNMFEGKSFCFTGAINKVDEYGNRFTRKKMEELVIQNGGTVGSVNKKLTYLVQADENSQSDKTKKAIAFGTTILSENNFFKMIGM